MANASQHPVRVQHKHRVYDKADIVIPTMWEEMLMAEKVLYGWHARKNDQIIALMHPFEAGNIEELESDIETGWWGCGVELKKSPDP